MFNFRILPDNRRAPDVPQSPCVGPTMLRASYRGGSSFLNIDNVLEDA